MRESSSFQEQQSQDRRLWVRQVSGLASKAVYIKEPPELLKNNYVFTLKGN